MKLDVAFRKTIETVGLENYSKKRFSNTLRDHYHLESSELFIWNSLISSNIIEDFLSIKNQRISVLGFIDRTSFRTGFNNETLKSLLISFWKGCIMAFYGIFPPETGEFSIKQTYFNNFSKWRERENTLKSGIVMVKRDSLFGWYNLNGDEIIPCKFSSASQFNDGLACVHTECLWGFINIMGNIEIDLNTIIHDKSEIAGVSCFSKGVAVVYGKGKIGFLTKTGKYTGCIFERFSLREMWGRNYFLIEQNGLYGLMDYDCNLILDPQLKEIGVFGNNGEETTYAKNADNKWVIINSKGKLSLCSIPSYKITLISISKIFESFYIGVEKELKKYGKYHLPNYYYSLYDEHGIRINGNIKIVEYYPFNNMPVLCLSNTGKMYFFDNKGIIGNENGYEYAYPFYNDHTWIKTCGKWRRMNRFGEELDTVDFDIISEEINGKVLIRETATCNIGIYDCVQHNVFKTIPNSKDVYPQRVINLKMNEWYYKISNEGNKPLYLWINGDLFIYERIHNLICRWGAYAIVGAKGENAFDLFYDGQYVGTFSKKDSRDGITKICRKSENNTYTIELTSHSTETGQYLISIKHNTVYISDVYERCEINSATFDNSSIVRSFDGSYILLDFRLKEIFRASKIERTANGKFFIYGINGKEGVISEAGHIILPPEFDNIVVYKNY